MQSHYHFSKLMSHESPLKEQTQFHFLVPTRWRSNLQIAIQGRSNHDPNVLQVHVVSLGSPDMQRSIHKFLQMH